MTHHRQRPGTTTRSFRRAIGTRWSAQHGFSIVEATIALGLVFTILVGMLATVSSSVRGVVGSRQRSVAVGLAKQVLEEARGLAYAEVGHDLDDDPTLPTDPALVATGTNSWEYDGERLAGSSINWPARDESLPAPFYPHQRTVTRNATAYDVSTYVTHVEPAELAVPKPGAPYKRLSVIVGWSNAQHGDAIDPEVRIESLLFETVEPPDPLLQALSDIDGGVISVVGFVHNVDLDDAFLWMPYAHGEIDSQFIRRVSGSGASARSQLNLTKALTTDDLLGCTVTNSVKTAECRGVKATTVADNDEGTAPGTHDHDGPRAGASGTIRRNDLFGITMSEDASGYANIAESRSSAAACGTPCPAPHEAYSFPENDGLPYHQSEASGPGSFRIFFEAGGVEGDIAAASGPAVARSVVDRDDVAGDGTVTASGSMAHPAIRVLSFVSAVYDALGVELLASYGGAVRIDATSASVSAAGGPGVAAPSCSADGVLVEVFDTTSLAPGYISDTFTPCSAGSLRGTADVTVNGLRVLMETTVTSPAAVVKTDVVGSTYYEAEISATSWLVSRTRLQIWGSNGSVLADLIIDVDYGRLLARAKYQEAGA